MIQKYIIDKTDVHDLLTGKDLPLSQVPQGSRAKAFCVEIAGKLTNGDVINAVFPNESFFNDIFLEVMHYGNYQQIVSDWWNAPYKTESEV